MWRRKRSREAPEEADSHLPARSGESKHRYSIAHSWVSPPVVAKLVGRQVLVDVEQRWVWVGRQVDVEQGDDRLEALGVDDRPLLQCKGRSVEDEGKMRRAAERGPVLKLNCDRLALLGDIQKVGVSGEVNVVGKQELERCLANKIFVLRVELFVDDGDAAPVGDDLEPRRIGIFEAHMTGASHVQL